MQSVQPLSGTGINPWWRYEERTITGNGHAMINVGTGNLVLQADDMSVPHKGIALAFRRTYNSQSLHDVNGDEGGAHVSTPGMYGNGWTNTFDAHVVKTGPGNWSVYDVDGARYDYVANDPANSSAGYSGPPGLHATFASDGQCGLTWTKKTGTTYYFYRDNPAVGCPALPTIGGYAGRLYQIIGRNRNTFLTFLYSWVNGDASATGKVSAITVQAESGLSATLSFGDVSGHRLLQQITFPDGMTAVTYGYDAAGNLTSVSRPPNNAGGTRPVQTFGYQTLGTGSVLLWAASPRWCASTCGTDGAFTAFGFSGSSQTTLTVSAISRAAVINPTISDGSSSTVLQPGYSTAAYYYANEYYATGGSNPTFRDSDGHATNWIVDSLGRPTQTQECTAGANQTCTGMYLITNETWDSDNNLVSETDARGNETDYLHDPMGNTTAVGEPYTTTSQGAFKPTRIYDYDGFSNVVSFCDEDETHRANADWTPISFSVEANDALCASQVGSIGHWRATYSYPSYEPYGELMSMTTPMGYTRTLSYLATQQGGIDSGLPTSVVGASLSEADGSTITPTQTFWYDANGSLRCYSKGQGAYVLSYDALGRMTSEADPDDSSANSSSLCGKTSGQPGWNTQTTSTYYPDGSLASSQSSAQRAGGVSTTFTYDQDGDETTETHHYGCATTGPCTAGVTTKWYDGADRLVEVKLPPDISDAYRSPWLTRYLYDLSAGSGVSISGTPFKAYGHLFKTQEWVPAPGDTSPSWLDQKASAFDALDREVVKYSYSPSSDTTLRSTTMTFDGNAGSLGLLTAKTDAVGETTSYTYDNTGHTIRKYYAGDNGVTPAVSFTYDADGRTTTSTGVAYGTMTTQYDADGRVSEVDEPTGGALTSPARLVYNYYSDGSRKALNVSSSALTATPLISYSYRADGARSLTSWNQGGSQKFASTHTDGGRLLSRSDPYTAMTMPSPQAPVAPGTRYVPTTRTYDTTGQLSTLALPVGLTYSALINNDEGHLSAWTANSSQGPVQMQRQESSRGEAGAVSLANRTIWTAMFSNGAVIPAGTDPQNYYDSLVDPVNSAVVGTTDVIMGTYFGDLSVCGQRTDLDSYDAAGRLVGKHLNISFTPSSPGCDSQMADPPAGESSSYDAENHTIAAGGCALYGPTGKPYFLGQCSAGGGNSYPHFDGDQVLFVTDDSGGLINSKLELLAEYTPFNGITVTDRDHADFAVTSHNAQTYYGTNFGVTSVQSRPHAFSDTTPGYTTSSYFMGSSNAPSCALGNCGPNIPLQYTRPEGFGWSGITIQGVRATDSASGQWTTPDAYAGDIHDPMSQKAFMLDRNNPYEYSDPSGYDPYVILDPKAALGNGHLMIAVMNPTTGRGTLYSQGPIDGSPGHVRQVVTQTKVSMADLAGLVKGGDSMLTEHTSASQDRAMDKRATEIANQSLNYNVITCNCDQFVKHVLAAADKSASDNLNLQPRSDFIGLGIAGFNSGHPGAAPDGFTQPRSP